MMKKKHIAVIVCLCMAAAALFPQAVLAEEPKVAKDNSPEDASVAASGDTLSPDLLKRPNYRRFNVRLCGGASFALGDDLSDHGLGEYGGQGLIGVDWVLVDPLALSVLVGYTAFSQGDQGALQDLFATVGFMLRLFPDKEGALGEKGGNALGHLFLDAHFGYHNYEREDRAGYNVGVGYEFSLSKDFNFGPYFRFAHVPIGDGFSYMSASVGIQASVGGKFEPDDADKDGIEDENDACPLIAEDVDKFEDGDGCPEVDNDKDGVDDKDDQCPDIAGVASNFGCEENDRDHDGIPNKKDACPDAAEDKDGFEDKDGCPDIDNDKDGVLDADDKCPDNAEDKDGFEDGDGCPDNDNDKDGILDDADKCPLLPETVNELDDSDGCPDFVRLTDDAVTLLAGVDFVKNKTTIQDRSKPMLAEAAALLKLRPEMKLRIEAYTDNTLSKKAGQKRSAEQAEAVKAFFVTEGVDAGRLTAVGLGADNPLADNTTKDGRAKNNRIELHIEKPVAPAEGKEIQTGEPEVKTPVAETPASDGNAPSENR